MRNFDEILEQDLEFQIGGEQFKMRYVRPEVLAVWEDEPIDEKSADLLKRQDDRIMVMLNGDDDSRERWLAMRNREDKALPMVQLNELLRWMIEVQTSRPTNTPLPSASGRGKTAATSRGA
jgi:hypothetical protein